MSNSPTRSVLLSRYFTHLRMNNWSPMAISRRDYALGKFIVWCSDRDIDNVAEITTEALFGYRRWLYHHHSVKSTTALTRVREMANRARNDHRPLID
ncbi:hypothetical protein [Stieleria mannarensis]|uniref:hypothetical protein n=1 Tax=Stieleria mannarensis TaxID=2755585 RepID=UPI0015FFA5BD|nr:hypothetical protein [Rhodopirellula sp. JC639]